MMMMMMVVWVARHLPLHQKRSHWNSILRAGGGGGGGRRGLNPPLVLKGNLLLCIQQAPKKPWRSKQAPDAITYKEDRSANFPRYRRIVLVNADEPNEWTNEPFNKYSWITNDEDHRFEPRCGVWTHKMLKPSKSLVLEVYESTPPSTGRLDCI